MSFNVKTHNPEKSEQMVPPIRKIICAVDFSEYSKEVISFGSILCRRLEAEMVVYHTICDMVNPLFGTVESRGGDIGRKAVERAVARIREMAGGCPDGWRPAVSFGDPVEEILKQVHDESADLVMAASYGLSGVHRLLAGTLVERLARTLPCPFWVVNPKTGRLKGVEEGFSGIRKVIVGCDPDMDFSRVLSYGRGFASLLGAHLTIFHAVERPFDGEGPDTVSGCYGEMQSVYMERIRSDILLKAEAAGVDMDCVSVEVRPGFPGDEMVRGGLGESDDLIVLGVRERGLLTRLFIGSTVEAVLRRTSGSVLIVPRRSETGDRK